MSGSRPYSYQKLMEEEEGGDGNETIKSVSPRRDITMKWRASIFLGLIGLSLFITGFVTNSWGQANGDVSLLSSFGVDDMGSSTDTSVQERAKRNLNNVYADGYIPSAKHLIKNLTNYTSGQSKRAKMLASKIEKLLKSDKDNHNLILSKLKNLIISGRMSSKDSEKESATSLVENKDIAQTQPGEPLNPAKNGPVDIGTDPSSTNSLSSDSSVSDKVQPSERLEEDKNIKGSNYDHNSIKGDYSSSPRHHTFHGIDTDSQGVTYIVKAGIWRLCIDATIFGQPRKDCFDYPKSIDGLPLFKVIMATSFLAIVLGFLSGICCGVLDYTKLATVSSSFVVIFAIISFVCGIVYERQTEALDSHLTVGWSAVVYSVGCLFLLFSGLLQGASRTREEVPVKKYAIL